MKKIKINKIPSIFKNVDLSDWVYLSDQILPEEGSFIVIQALKNEGKKDDLDYPSGRLGKLVEGDIIPGVLGYRNASVEFAGFIPKKVKKGDELSLLCESGLFGQISGVFETWGHPMKVKVLGSIVDNTGKQLHLSEYSLPLVKKTNNNIPIIAFLATRMDSGKTIMACKIAHALKLEGNKVAAAKVTGVGYTQDLYKLKEYGASPVLDFVDMGLPSTCGPNGKKVADATENLVNHIGLSNPDIILMEFGDGILGEYHVSDILKRKTIKNQISFVILAANDFSGIYGTQKILAQYDLKIDLVTGPIANSKSGIDLIKKYFNLEAESNQHGIAKAIHLISKKSLRKIS